MPAPEPRSRVNSRDELLDVALSLFSRDGFAATSLQHIADAAGYSKSSVLYHFSTKEAVLDAALRPAIDALGCIAEQFDSVVQGVQAQSHEMIERFVDFLLLYRRQAAIVLIQGQTLADVPIIAESNGLVQRLSDAITLSNQSLEDQMRVGVGLAGAAYTLIAADSYLRQDHVHPDDDVRAALISVLTDLFRMER